MRLAVHYIHLTMGSRLGAERFTAPEEPNQRRYEALRAYFVEGLSAQAVAERFGYTRATVETLVQTSAPGGSSCLPPPPGAAHATQEGQGAHAGLALRREGRSLREIERALAAEGVPLSRTAIWELASEEGLGRLEPEQDAQSPVEPLAAAPRRRRKRLTEKDWVSPQRSPPSMPGCSCCSRSWSSSTVSALIRLAGYPSTTQLAARNSLLALLALKLYEQRRRSHVYDVVHDRALGLFCGLNVLPKRTHLTSYSYRTTREHNLALLGALVPRQRAARADQRRELQPRLSRDHELRRRRDPRRTLRSAALATHPRGAQLLRPGRRDRDALLRQRRPRPRPSSHTRSSASASSGRPPPARSPDCWCSTRRSPPTPSWPNSTRQDIGFITLRRRGANIIKQIEALPDSAWTAGAPRSPRQAPRRDRHRDRGRRSRDAASASSPIRGLGREQPTLLLTNRRQLTHKQLIERYAKRWLIENQLSPQIRAFHLDALASQVPLAVDLDTTLSIIADNIYRHFARRLTGYQTATPDTIFRHFIKTPGQLHFTPTGVEVRLKPRSRTPVLLDAGYQQRTITVPWWGDRQLSYSFPPA